MRKGFPCWSNLFLSFFFLGPNLAAVRGFRRRYSKARFRDAFEASFVGDMSAPGSVRQGFPCWGQSFPFHFSFFLMGFVSDVSRVFVVAVSHGLGPNLAAVRGFRRRYSKARFRDDFEASFVGDMSAPGSVRKRRFESFPCWLGPIFSFHSFFFRYVSCGVRKRRFESFCGGESCFFAWLGPESCCCSRLSQAVLRGRDAFEASFVGDMSAPGSARKGFRKGVPCWSQSFRFIFLFNGFRKRRFESFCGGGFAWLGPESCCCSRLSQAVLQGQISRRF